MRKQRSRRLILNTDEVIDSCEENIYLASKMENIAITE